MAKHFKIGDHVAWSSEAGRVSGTIIKVHTKLVTWKGYTHHASKEEPQYEIKSDKTDHVALHKGSALAKTPRAKPVRRRKRRTRVPRKTTRRPETRSHPRSP